MLLALPLGELSPQVTERAHAVSPVTKVSDATRNFPAMPKAPSQRELAKPQALTERAQPRDDWGSSNPHPICKLNSHLFCVLRRFSAILRQCKKLCGFCLTGGCLRVIMNT